MYLPQLLIRKHTPHTAIDDEYQAFLVKKATKTTQFEEVQSEMHGLLTEVGCHNSALHRLLERERGAREVVAGHPQRISQLQDKLAASTKLLSTEP